MNTSPLRHASIERLRLALDVLSSALEQADLRPLLAAQTSLVEALGEVQQATEVAASDRARLRQQLPIIRAALRRCRQVSSSLAEVAAAWMVSRDGVVGYNRVGSSIATGSAGLEATVSCRV